MSLMTKVMQFASSPAFRSAKMRQWAWPLVIWSYPNLAYVGVQAQDDDPVILHARDRFITTDFIKFGKNASPLDAALRIAQASGCELGGVFLDVGANVGTETMAALGSGLFDRAIAIELAPTNVRLMNANLALRGLGGRVRVFANGASDRSDQAAIEYSQVNYGDHRVATVRPDVETVPLRTIDEMLAEAGESATAVSLLWIDVQGYEGFVLKGARTLLDHGTPLVIEYTPSSLDTYGCHDVLIELLTTYYRYFFDLSQPAPVRRAAVEIEQLRRTWAAGREHTDLLFV